LALGAASLFIAPSPVLQRLVVASLVVMAGAVFVIVKQRRRRMASYNLAVIIAFLSTPPTIYILDVGSPVDGILGFALLYYAIDAPRRWAIAGALTVITAHVGLEVSIALGVFPQHALVDVSPSVPSRLSNSGSTLSLYIVAMVVARVYRQRVAVQLEELAEAGREVAARGVLLREARLDLERATKVGERGRFTDQVLGSFVLGPILGSGGMGDVYEARHHETNARAAVKLLRPLDESGESADVFQRFEREAAIVGKLESPHIVRLLEVGGLEAPFPYMAMELLDGTTLNRMLEEEAKLSPARVASMLVQVARGLSAAKKHDVVHRDIKPSNLFLVAESQEWKILDFGLGRIAGDSATLTGGGLVGTLGYLAPEQLTNDHAVSHRTDIHALAIVAYRALTGRHVFVERDAAKVMREVESRLPPKPSSLAPVSSAVDDILRIALAKDPKARFDDAEELARAFEKAVQSLDEHGAFQERAKKLPVDWTLVEGQQPLRPVRGGQRHQRREPTKTLSLVAPPAAPDEPVTLDAPPPAPVVVPPPPPSSEVSELGSRSERVTLVASPDQLVQSLWLAPARSVTLAFGFATVYSFFQIPMTPFPEMRLFGFAALTLLLGVLFLIRKFSADSTERGLRLYHTALACAFINASLLLYFFSPFCDTASFFALALMLVGSGVSNRLIAIYLLCLAVPHSAMHLAITFGALKDRGFYVFVGSTYAHLLNLAQSWSLYVLAAILAVLFRETTKSTLKSLSDTFRQNTEREALLRDARLTLERAMGLGQPGRFTGMELGQFHLGVVLGRGGMGEVYEAIRGDTGEPAAVKLLTRRRATDDDVLARFAREAKTVAALDSKNIVRVLDAGSASSATTLPYIAMEKLVGSDLASLLQRRLFLSGKEVAEMVTQIAAGLEIAHARGVVHADITPRNLFFTNEGVWKLLDFGVAVLGREGKTEHATAQAAGTPAYLAPEQLEEGAEVDHRVDIHALGVVVYRALTGRPAFAGRDAVTVLYRVLHDMPTAPSETSTEVSALVDDVLRIALAKDPNDRFDRAATFAEALTSAINGTRDERIARRATNLTKKASWSARRKS